MTMATTETAPPAGGPTGSRSPGRRPADTSRWIRTYYSGGPTASRLVCFPHAGGAANAFTRLSAALPRDIELLAVQYPGRQDRRAEPCAEDIQELAAGAAEALAGYTDQPLFLLGHSMG
ncbi:thioesterase II family protein, partial [Streptacidiphilus carbonis]|uniref:thioesterase II family protein n=1 Tax=Streptacidiphilus carbonis TaxID=105422 RepID=UPI001EEE10A9